MMMMMMIEWKEINLRFSVNLIEIEFIFFNTVDSISNNVSEEMQIIFTTVDYFTYEKDLGLYAIMKSNEFNSFWRSFSLTQ